MKCPSCKSERCGNHAACARRKKDNEDRILIEIQKLGAELGRERGRPLSRSEWERLAHDFMAALSQEVKKQEAAEEPKR